MRPRVGVTCSTTIHEERDLVALEEVYAEAVSRAGGLPFVLPTLEPSDATEVLASLDGLILAGGGDVEPSAVRQRRRTRRSAASTPAATATRSRSCVRLPVSTSPCWGSAVGSR